MMEWSFREVRNRDKKPEFLDRSFGEPELELGGGGFRIAAAVSQGIINRQGQISSNGARSSVDWVGGSHHRSDGFGCVGTADGHRYDWSAD